MCGIIKSRRTKLLGCVLFIILVYFIKIKTDLDRSSKWKAQQAKLNNDSLHLFMQNSSDYPEQEYSGIPGEKSDVFYFESDNGNDDPVITQRSLFKKNYLSLSYGTRKETLKTNETKYILLRTNETMFSQFKEGKIQFDENNCTNKNCYFTRNIRLFDDVRRFDAVIFGTPKNKFISQIPRSSSQKYIFAAQESAALYPAIDTKHDKFYNLTWTYKLDSDIPWRYFRIYNKSGHDIGPAINIDWHTEMSNGSDFYNELLLNKSKAAVRTIRKCFHENAKEQYFVNLKEELQRYNLTIDSFGSCENDSMNPESNINDIIKEQYFFYLAFEDYIDKDFVTDDVLNAFNNYAVPIVYGGADYKRFLPTGSYLNAQELKPHELAYEIHVTMNNLTRYQTFFRWKNHYNVEPAGLSEICNLCAALHNDDMMRTSIHKRFRLWWNGPERQNVIDFFALIFTVDKTVQNMVMKHNMTSDYKELLNTIRRHVDVPSFESFLNQNININGQR